MSEIIYSRQKMDTSGCEADRTKLIIGRINKNKLLDLINSKDPSVSLVLPKSKAMREFIYNIKFNGAILRDLLYCKKCDTILKSSKGSTSNIAAHCKKHILYGDGYTYDEYVATKYHFPKNISESDNPRFNVQHSNPVQIEGKITTDLIKSWKDKNLLPPKPPLSIRRIYNIKDDGGTLTAVVKWNDPEMGVTSIPQDQLFNYYIYDPVIRYEDSSEMEEKSSELHHKHLSKRQVSTIERMKDEIQHRHNDAHL